MNTHTFDILQFNEIKKEVARYALSDLGKEKVLNLYPSFNKKQIEAQLHEVTEAKVVLEKSASVPIHSLTGMQQIFRLFNKGAALRPDQLMTIYELLDTVEKLRRFMQDKTFIAPHISSYVNGLANLNELSSEIIRCIRNGQVDDYASKELLRVRKQISIYEQRLKDRLEKFVKSAKYTKYLQDTVVSIRNGRHVISVKKEYRKMIAGTVLDTSASGSTVFLEPDEIAHIQGDIELLQFQEEAEVQQVLLFLTGLVEQHEQDIKLAVETMVHYDVLFAKAKYSVEINGNPVKINDFHYVHLKQARHPLLREDAVPLTLELGDSYDALVITGPNTGGKTVTIKTVGLLTIMAQAGLHIPCKHDSDIAIFNKILVDIGDGQSIEQSLSTFSSRITNIIEILKETTHQTLVLIDELGSGTDPGEGMGLATSILQELYDKGATLLATTHYSEIKEFATDTEGFENGSMEFDLDSLQPTYRLLIGKGGDSQAFAIALKLGMHPRIVERAHHITYKAERSYNSSFEQRELEKQLAYNQKHIRQMKHKHRSEKIKVESLFKKGDNVKIPHLNEHGIVRDSADEKGEVVLLVKGEFKTINQKRLELYIKSEDLYPPDYDFDIIFKSKDYRKKDKLMSKHHVDGLIINHTEQ
ncbi:endonuclease MutS2 [Bacillus sp. HMF5848]|uniref:endonuclease MutS2 n=1 Tax=Bacillus sp. HMF5848 TaxID=2495421 RepID=UPI000F778E3D|nr:endonuclease MutS2 [Bacillus sp. HMF5848]RSK26029.1 endonuclease MutS2 [Bacillus sp. HMF5848]